MESLAPARFAATANIKEAKTKLTPKINKMIKALWNAVKNVFVKYFIKKRTAKISKMKFNSGDADALVLHITENLKLIKNNNIHNGLPNKMLRDFIALDLQGGEPDADFDCKGMMERNGWRLFPINKNYCMDFIGTKEEWNKLIVKWN